MPMTRYQVRNEFSLADPELYKAADKDDPEALLEGVAMAGLVGVLRQLGDLAEFAAEIFHDLHEEVMVTAARSHTLMSRVQQLESEFPPIEKAFLSQTSHSTFFSNSGAEWYPNLQINQNIITKGDLPRFVMDSYEEARGPPRLFLLDKFDIAGAGSCLKRYTDPSFYKVESSLLDMASVDVQRDKKFRKAKKKGPRWKHGETPEILPSIKLHQLFLEERVESGASDPARLIKLKRKSSASSFGSENGKSYMEKFLKTPLEDKMVHEVSVNSSPLKLPSKSTTMSGHEIQILDVSNTGPVAEPVQRIRGPYPPPSLGRTIISPSKNDFVEAIVEEKTLVGATSNRSFDDKNVVIDGKINEEERESNHSDYDDTSEIENYMDALATMDSEVEMDTEFRPKKEDVGFLNIEKHRTDSDLNDEHLLSQNQFSDSQSIGNFTASDDGNSSIRKGVSSFSCSDDTASTSAEETPSPSNNQESIIEKIRVDQLPENEVSDNGKNSDKSRELETDDSSSEASEILSDPTKTEEQQTDDKSEISCGPTETEGEAEESGEFFSGMTEIKEQPTDDIDENSGGLTKMEEQLENDEISPRLSYEEHLEDEAEVEESYVVSCTVIDKANILEEIHEKEGSENSLEDVIETKFVENVSARNSVDTQNMSPDSAISHPEEQPSVLHLEGLAENINDDLSNKFDSEEIGLVYSEERDLDGTRDGELSRDSESDVEKDGNESHMNPMAGDLLSHVSEYQDPPSLSDNHSQSDEREDKIIHAEDDVERACKSSLPEDQGSEFVSQKSSLPEDPAGGSEFASQKSSLLKDSAGGSELSSQLEPRDSPDHMNHKTKCNTDIDSFDFTISTQTLEQGTELHVEDLDVGPLVLDKVTRKSSQVDLVELNETNRESLTGPTLDDASMSELPQSYHTFDLSQKVNAPLNQASAFPGFNLLPEVAQLNLEEMPPLPPLPPMQWRIGGKLPHGRDDGQQVNHFPPIFSCQHNENVQASNPFLPLPPMNVANSRHEDLMGNMVNLTPFLLQMPTPIFVESQDDFFDLNKTQSSNPFKAVSETNSERPQHSGEGVVDHSGRFNDHLTLGQSQPSNLFETISAPSDEKPQCAEEEEMIAPTVDHSDSQVDFIASGQTQSSNPFTALPATPDNSFTPTITPGPTSTCSSEKTPDEESTESPHQLSTEASLGKEEEQDDSSLVFEMMVVGPPEDFVPHLPVENRLPEHVEPITVEAQDHSSLVSSSVNDEKPNAFPSVDNEKSNENQIPKFPKPRSPLIDAVAAHDKSKLRKVTERVRPKEQVEERDSILEQIRMKSFNLKPAVPTRPTIHGPRTNLRVAAILEKANAIRQAFAGSDDDDDDSWSDS